MTTQDFLKKYNIRLNEQQLEAMQAVDGPVLTLATPGSGKTTLFVARLGYMILVKGISPDKILPMTYTVAATQDMSERFRNFFGNLADEVEFKTINAVCLRILKEYGRIKHKNNMFEVLENEKRVSYIKDAISQVNKVYPTESDINEVGLAITRCKNLLYTKEQIAKYECEVDNFSKIYDAYEQALHKTSRMDFDDQLVYGHRVLKENPQMLEWIRDKYDYICVDECQDNSRVQNEIIQFLSGGKNNIFEVGDIDQSIYRFRGAAPKDLMSFERNYPNAKVLYMEPNYRCDGNIIKAADRFIQLNKNRYKLHVKATRPAVNKIRKVTLAKRELQYDFIKEYALSAKEKTAILYRYNESAIPVADLFLRENIPFSIRQLDTSFFTNKVVNDICDMMRFAIDPSDTDAFMRIYNKLRFYLKKEVALQACRFAKQHGHKGMSVLSALDHVCSNNIRALDNIELMEKYFERLREISPQAAITMLISVMGYGDYLKNNHINPRKIDILKIIAGREKNIKSFLERLTMLPQLIDDKPKNHNGNIVLSTIHSAKGLEWPAVIIIDAFDGYFPETIANYRRDDADTIDTYEEERREYYIAVTRARDELIILVYGDCANTFTNQLMGYDNAKVSHTNSVRSFSKSHIANKPSVKVATSIERPFIEAEYREFKREMKPGRTVYHKQYGSGKIMYVEMDEVAIRIGDSEKMFSMKTLFTKELIRFRSGY